MPRSRYSKPVIGPVPSLTCLLLALLAGAPAAAQIRIQEVLYDGPSSDADDVFTELVGPAGMQLDGWRLVGINGGSGAAYRTVELQGSIPADGVLVVATDAAVAELAAERDLIGNVDWQNGPDAVQLADTAGTVVDALQYGDAGAHNAGEGSPAPTVPAGQSLSRDDDGADTDDNLHDFSPLTPPTPGVGPRLGSGGGGGGGGGGGDPMGLTISLPDTAASGGDTLIVPVRLTDASGLGLLAVETFVTFDGNLLTLIDVTPADLVDTLRWQLAAHVLTGNPLDTLRIALATDVDTLRGAGALVHVRFAVADLRRPALSGLAITHVAANDDTSSAMAHSGTVGLVGNDAMLQVAPRPIRMHHPLTITVTDPDEDRDSTTADVVTVRLTEGPESGPAEQHDTLTAHETGAATGVFVGAVATAFAAPVSANGRLEISPRRRVTACYDDSLDAAGNTTTRCDTLFVPAHDGRLQSTVVAQPGDTLWLRLVDADLDVRPDAIDTARVVAFATTTGHTARVHLVELALSDSVFVGSLVTTRETSGGDSLSLAVVGGGAVNLGYVDNTPATGDSAIIVDTTRVLALFGDADGNGQLQALDAASVLRHVLSPYLTGDDSLAANVDSMAPYGDITPYDASLILQHRVGLRRRFPVQASDAANHPRSLWTTPSPARPAVGAARQLALHPAGDGLALWVEDRGGIVAADVVIACDGPGPDGPGASAATRLERYEVSTAPQLPGFLARVRQLSASPDSQAHHLLRVVLAGASPVGRPGELFRLRFGAGPVDPASMHLVKATINDGSIPVHLPAAGGHTEPVALAFLLHPNHPNPFNGGTVIPLDLPVAARICLSVHDVLGRRVADLVVGPQPAGHRLVHWDGRDARGYPVASGVYFARLQLGLHRETRRMLLLR